MIHLKFDLDQIKMSKSFDFSKKIECIYTKEDNLKANQTLFPLTGLQRSISFK